MVSTKRSPDWPSSRKKQNGPLHHVDDLLLGSEDPVQRAAFRHLLAPASADIDSVSGRGLIYGAKRAFADTAPAVVARLGVNLYLSIL